MDVPQRRLTYVEHAPDPRLADHIACYWTYVGKAALRGDPSEPVVPDGAMDLLFDLTEGSGVWVGAMTRPIRVAREGAMAMLGVRFRSGAGAAWAGVPASDLTDRTVRAGMLDTAYERWGERLAAASSEPAAVAGLDRLLLGLRASRQPTPDPRILRATRLLRGATDLPDVDDLARAAGLGRRQLERRFRAEIGLTPRQARRVERLRRAIASLLDEPGMPLARVAVRSGYFDQAHFGREFRRLADETPAAFRARRHRSVEGSAA